MVKRLRAIAIVAFILAVFTGTVSAYSGSQITVQVEDNKKVTIYKTYEDTVEDLFNEIGLEISEEDKLNMSLNSTIKDGDKITIKRALSITITLDGVPRMVKTSKSTVSDLLKSISGTLSANYTVDNVKENELLKEGMVINLTSLDTKVYTKSEAIAFETQTKENPDLPVGTTKVAQKGDDGKVEITITEVYSGSTLVSSEETSKKIVALPVNQIVEIGTKEETVSVVSVAGSINNMDYVKTIKMEATGYTQYDPGCDSITASGMLAQKGVVAVDTSVIPFGTKLYIPGYGIAVAGDRGGAIVGNRIDLCYDTVDEAYAWGRRNVTVYVLKD